MSEIPGDLFNSSERSVEFAELMGSRQQYKPYVFLTFSSSEMDLERDYLGTLSRLKCRLPK